MVRSAPVEVVLPLGEKASASPGEKACASSGFNGEMPPTWWKCVVRGNGSNSLYCTGGEVDSDQ